jgi:hypothetical protein
LALGALCAGWWIILLTVWRKDVQRWFLDAGVSLFRGNRLHFTARSSKRKKEKEERGPNNETKRQDRNTKKPKKSQQKMRDLAPKKEVRGGYWPQKPDGTL